VELESIQDLKSKYFFEEDVLRILKIKKSTLSGRLSRGTEHPPYIELSRGVRIYPKREFMDWISKRRVIWEVKSAS
jgi:hypothetical protein